MLENSRIFCVFGDFFVILHDFINMAPTTRHHYVWREYLRSWSKNVPGTDKIFTLLKSQQNRIVKTNLMNVAQENGFYRMYPLTNTEVILIKDLIFQLQKEVQNDFLIMLGYYEKFNYIYQKIIDKGETIEEHPNLKSIEMELFEHFNGRIEYKGFPLLRCRNAEELREFAKDYLTLGDIFIYLNFQYIRTKSMRDNLVKGYAESPKLSQVSQKAWPLLAAFFGMSMAFNTFKNDNTRFIFLHNQTKIPFVTGDQPIINVDANNVVDGHVVGWKLYYPLSPNLALLIDQVEDGERYIDMSVDQAMARYYNHIEYEEASDFVFSHTPEALNDL
ncbi:MAG: DUF4238 domain-containing protein [Acidaminococcaceae bacterium]|nr:DUF4238 domain-containing protein [Acidaminococcaceae bacterium]